MEENTRYFYNKLNEHQEKHIQFLVKLLSSKNDVILVGGCIPPLLLSGFTNSSSNLIILDFFSIPAFLMKLVMKFSLSIPDIPDTMITFIRS